MGSKDRENHRDREEKERGKGHRDREEFEFSTTTRGIQVAEYLTRIADGLAQGTLVLKAGGEAVHLQPAEIVRLEVEAESKPDKGTASLQLELSWKLTTPAREPREEPLVIETDSRAPQLAVSTPKGKEA